MFWYGSQVEFTRLWYHCCCYLDVLFHPDQTRIEPNDDAYQSSFRMDSQRGVSGHGWVSVRECMPVRVRFQKFCMSLPLLQDKEQINTTWVDGIHRAAQDVWCDKQLVVWFPGTRTVNTRRRYIFALQLAIRSQIRDTCLQLCLVVGHDGVEEQEDCAE